MNGPKHKSGENVEPTNDLSQTNAVERDDCLDSDKAVRRQARLENSRLVELTESGIDKVGDTLNRLVFGNGKHTAEIFSAGSPKKPGSGRHLARAEAPSTPSKASHKTAAGVLAFISTLSPAVNAAEWTPDTPRAVIDTASIGAASSLIGLSPELVINERQLTLDDLMTAEDQATLNPSAAVPVYETQGPTTNPETTNSSIKQPLIRTLFPGQTISDLVATIAADLTRQERKALVEQVAQMSGVDLESGQDRKLKVGYQIKLPIDTAHTELYTVKKGDTAAQLYKQLGFKQAGYSFDEFLKIQAIADKDSIRAGWRMFKSDNIGRISAGLGQESPATPPVPSSQPKEEPPLPPTRRPEIVSAEPAPKPSPALDEPPKDNEIIAIARQVQAGEAEAGQVIIDNQQIALENSRQLGRVEAEQALSLLVQAVRDYENPLHDLAVPAIEHQPTPVADRLRSELPGLVEELTSGQTNLAYLQSETIRRLATDEDGRVNLELVNNVAGHFVLFIAERNQWTLAEGEADSLAEMMARGAQPIDLSTASHAQREAASMADRLDHSSLTVDLYQANLQAHLEEQVQLVSLAEQQLEMLRSSMRDLEPDELEEIARKSIQAKIHAQPVNDYAYEVFQAKLGEQANESAVLKLLGRQLYAARQSDDILELFPSVQNRMAETVDGWLTAEGPKSLSGLLETLNSQLDEQIGSITERGNQLKDIEQDLEDLYPDLADLSPEQTYELAKNILSQAENGPLSGDDWMYLTELKTPDGQNLSQTLQGLVRGVYRLEGLDGVLAASPAEQAAVAGSIDQFLGGSELNLKEFLSGHLDSLTGRMAASEEIVSTTLSAMAKVLPEIEIGDELRTGMAIGLMSGGSREELAAELIEVFESQTGRQLTIEETARIDIEIIRLEKPDSAERLDSFADYLFRFYSLNNAAFYLDGASDPAIQTLSMMLENDRYEIADQAGQQSIFSESFIAKMRAYNTVPNSLFPGVQWLIKGYAGQDLTPYFEHLGVDVEAVLASPYNRQLKVQDGKIIAEQGGAIWFGAELWSGGTPPDFEAAADWVYGEIPGRTYTVKKGDTLSAIGQMFRDSGGQPLTWQAIVEWNRGRVDENLSVGEVIVIPSGYELYVPEPVAIETPDEPESRDNGQRNHSVLQVRQNIVDVARGELSKGVIEDAGRNRDSKGIIAGYCNGQDHGWEWCACFASFVAEQSGAGIEGRFDWMEPGALKLRDAMAEDERFQFFKPGELKNNLNLKPGDFVFYSRGKGRGHVGVVVEVLGAHQVLTIDGNIGNALKEQRLDVVGDNRFVGAARFVGEPAAGSTPSPESVVSSPESSNHGLEAEHQRIKTKVDKEVAGLKTYDNPFGLTASDINAPRRVYTVEEMAQNRLERDRTKGNWSEYIGPSEGAREVMEALIVYGGLMEIDAPGFTSEELLVATTATMLGEGGGFTHIVGDLKVKPGARLDPTDDISWRDEIISISSSTGQFYWVDKYDGEFRDPELVGNDLRIAMSRAGQMIRQELAAGRHPLNKWHYYRDHQDDHPESFRKNLQIAQQVLLDLKSDS